MHIYQEAIFFVENKSRKKKPWAESKMNFIFMTAVDCYKITYDKKRSYTYAVVVSAHTWLEILST
eukprot:snap_masked-scaffold_55-processed-gene-0.21-mRNA-1 protein AED:1.00 eAED:1.00 QI:0/-1/0/0/-1/1/1/0/64